MSRDIDRRPPKAPERTADDLVRSPFRTLRAAARESFALVPATLALVWKSSRGGTLLLAALTLLASGGPLAIAYIGKRIVDAVVASDKHAALRWVILELAAIAAQALLQRGLGLTRALVGARLGIDVNLSILEKAQTLELRHLEDPEFYDQLTRARREASSRPLSVVNETFTLLQNTLTLLGYVALLVREGPIFVVGLALAALPSTIAEMRFSSQAFRLRNWRAPRVASAQFFLEYVLANDNHAKEVMTFGLGPMLLARYRVLAKSIYEEDKKLAVRRAAIGFSLSLLATATFYGCYAWLAIAAAVGIDHARQPDALRRCIPPGPAGVPIDPSSDRRHVRRQPLHVEPLPIPPHPDREGEARSDGGAQRGREERRRTRDRRR